MKKKIEIIIIILLVILIVFIGYKLVTKDMESDIDDEPKIDNRIYGYLFDLDYYKGFDIKNVSSLTINRITEGGIEPEEVNDINEIVGYYNSLSKIKITSECDMVCDDNSIIYRFFMNDGNEYVVEKECDWFIVGTKRYYYEK